MKPKRKPTGEIPSDCRLPSTVEAIERGRKKSDRNPIEIVSNGESSDQKVTPKLKER